MCRCQVTRNVAPLPLLHMHEGDLMFRCRHIKNKIRWDIRRAGLLNSHIRNEQSVVNPGQMIQREHLTPTAGYLVCAGVVLITLTVSLEPDVGFSAPLGPRLLFWTLQVATGLIVLQRTLHFLAHHNAGGRLPALAIVLLSGLLGVFILTPAFWFIGEGLMETWLGYPKHQQPQGDEPLISFPSHPLIEEFFDILLPVTAAWTLICLPLLHGIVSPTLNDQRVDLSLPIDVVQYVADDRLAQNPSAPAEGIGQEACNVTAMHAEVVHRDHKERSTWLSRGQAPFPNQTTACLTARLPSALGSDIIAVASELQYLRVWTPLGCALILGALAEVESDPSLEGIRVHRSWWVARKHVIRIQRKAGGAVCLMSNGHQVPVSRRRRSDVIKGLGLSAVNTTLIESEFIPKSDLQ